MAKQSVSRTIDRISIDDQHGELRLSCRLGYSTMMPITMTLLILGVFWSLTSIFTLPDKWIGLSAAGPAALAGLLLLFATIFNRTRVKVTRSGIKWGTSPIPLPDYPIGCSLPADQIAAIFASPCAISNRYSQTYIHTYSVFALSRAGEPRLLLSRIRPADKAREVVALIEGRLGLTPMHPPPPLSTATRDVTEGDVTPTGFSPALFPAAAFLCGLLIFAAPWIRTISKTGVVGSVVDFETHYRSGRHGSYEVRRCVVEYSTPEGLLRNTIEDDDCSKSTKVGDPLSVYYDPLHPERIVLRSSWRQLFGFVFFLPGLAGLIYLFIARNRSRNSRASAGSGPQMLLEDNFRSLDGYWDLTKDRATVRKGALELYMSPGNYLAPTLCRSAFRSPIIDVQLQSKTGNGQYQAAGIQFWADGLGRGYFFRVMPLASGVDAWLINNHKWERVLPFTHIPQVLPMTQAWNALRVVTHESGKADLISTQCPRRHHRRRSSARRDP